MFREKCQFHPFLLSILFIGLASLMLPSLSLGHQEGPATAAPQTQSVAGKQTPEWVERSNKNAQVLLDVFGKYNPEFAGQIGVEGLDVEIIDLKPGLVERSNQATLEAATELRNRLAAEKDPLVRQDLEILIKSADDSIKGTNLNEKYQLQYFAIAQTIFSGMRALLDDQVPAERRTAALTRLNRYAGMEKGYTPITVLAEDRTREYLARPELMGPVKAQVEKDLANSDFFMSGIEELFKKYQITGYEPAYNKLKVQVAAYNDFLRKEILPKSRDDFRLPPALYEFSLEQVGIDIPASELASIAHAAFLQIQKEMQELAPKVAKQMGYSVTGYRDVIKELKKSQLYGDAILPHYQKRIQDLETIIVKEKVVTLPDREMRMRIASEAESAGSPAPNMRPPRLIGNTGEMGEFVLPLNIPAPAGSKELRYDDFTYEAASWTLTVHEGRPGHELQFASMIETGVSTARAIFAFNSVNVEGWALYAEKVMQPYEPLEGQLIALQARLQRAARAFLDPELQMGKITKEEAFRVLTQDVGLSEAMATQEVERYTFRAPGQATAYFYGYMRLMELRADVEKAQGGNFSQQKFHDFILSQGLLPPNLLRKAVMAEFVGTQTSN